MRQHLQHFSTKQTPQSEAIPGRQDMAENNAGGYGWKVDNWMLMQRFLILGTEGGTYYVGQRELTKDAATATLKCINEDGKRAIDLIVDVSYNGRAAKNDYALFALAIASGEGDIATRRYAFEVLPKVARIGTHLFNFVSYMEQFRGWGRLAREGIARWYNEMPPDRLAYQVVKYRQRDGWSHKDVIKLCKPMAEDKNQEPDNLHTGIYNYLNQKQGLYIYPTIIGSFILAQNANEKSHLIQLIKEHNLTREMLPTRWLKEKEIWSALLDNMPMTAMIRNLGNMGKVGLLVPGAFDVIEKVTAKLADQEAITNSRIHPLNILSAMSAYGGGHGYRGSGEWEVVGDVIDALNGAFYKAFDNVEPSGKRICIGLDVSGSMSSGEINGIPGMSPRMGACAMSMVTYKTEPKVSVMAFSDRFIPINMSRYERLDRLVGYTASLPFGGTDCALPILWALEAHRDNPDVVYDGFVIYTDSETWKGQIHPSQALNQYRCEVNPEARLVVVGMTANEISIADPQDAGMMDVVGFDTAAPGMISQFLKGEL